MTTSHSSTRLSLNEEDEKLPDFLSPRPLPRYALVAIISAAMVAMACSLMPAYMRPENPHLLRYGFEVAGKEPVHDFTFLLVANMTRHGVLQPSLLTVECFLPSMTCERDYFIPLTRDICDHPNVTSFTLINQRRYQCADIRKRDVPHMFSTTLSFTSFSLTVGMGALMMVIMMTNGTNITSALCWLMFFQLGCMVLAYRWVVIEGTLPYELVQAA